MLYELRLQREKVQEELNRLNAEIERQMQIVDKENSDDYDEEEDSDEEKIWEECNMYLQTEKEQYESMSAQSKQNNQRSMRLPTTKASMPVHDLIDQNRRIYVDPTSLQAWVYNSFHEQFEAIFHVKMAYQIIHVEHYREKKLRKIKDIPQFIRKELQKTVITDWENNKKYIKFFYPVTPQENYFIILRETQTGANSGCISDVSDGSVTDSDNDENPVTKYVLVGKLLWIP